MNKTTPPPEQIEISVVISVYNATHTIQSCINSVLNQTFRDFEIIIVDDGSTENVYELCKNLYDSLRNVHIIKNIKNMEQADALNIGIESAKGKYVAILHSDDMFMPEHLQKLYSAAEQTNADVIHGMGVYIPEPGQSSQQFKLKPVINDKNPVNKPTIMSDDKLQRFSEWINRGTHFDMHLNLFRREFLIKNDIKFENISDENTLFCFQWLMLANVYVKIPDITYIYRSLPDSISRPPKKPESISEILKTMTQGINCMDRYMSKMNIFKGNNQLQDIAKSYLIETIDFSLIGKLNIYKDNGQIDPNYEVVLDQALLKYFGKHSWLMKYYFNSYHKYFKYFQNQQNAANILSSIKDYSIRKLLLNTKKIKILVEGYFSLNLGDDLFFAMLIERYPNVLLFLPALPYKQYMEMFKDYPNVIFYTDQMSMNYDAIVIIGGSLFQSHLIESSYSKNEFWIKTFVSAGKRAFIIGANFDRNYENFKYNEKSFHEIFERSGDKLSVSLRDTHSYNYFQDLKNVTYAPDIIFGLNDKFLLGNNNRSGLGISIISISIPGRKGTLTNFYNTYLNSMIDLVKSAINRNINVIFFSFCIAEDDVGMFKKIYSQLNSLEQQSVRNVVYDGDIPKFLRAFHSMKYIVATRFHANVLALKFRQRLFPIVYNDKTLNLLEDIELFKEGEFYDIRSGEPLNVDKVWTVLESPKNSESKIKQYEKDSFQHFAKLDEFLSNNKIFT